MNYCHISCTESAYCLVQAFAICWKVSQQHTLDGCWMSSGHCYGSLMHTTVISAAVIHLVLFHKNWGRFVEILGIHMC